MVVLRSLIVLMTLSVAVSAEPPTKHYYGWITPTKFDGLFTLSNNSLSDHEKNGEYVRPNVYG